MLCLVEISGSGEDDENVKSYDNDNGQIMIRKAHWSLRLRWAKKKTRVTGSLWKVDFRNPPAWVAVFRGSSNDIYDPWLGTKWIIVGAIIRRRWGWCMCIRSTGPRSFKNNINRAVQWTVKMCRFITRLIVWWEWPWKEQKIEKDENNISKNYAMWCFNLCQGP